MPKRLYLILALLAVLTLACSVLSIQWSSPPTRPETAQAATPAPASTQAPAATQGVFLPQVPSGGEETPAATQGIYLPEVSSGAGSTPGPSTPQAQAPAAGSSTPTLNSLYLPEVNSGAGSPYNNGTPVPPQVSIQASALTLQVGEVLTITAHPSGIGLPYYDLVVQDKGSPQVLAEVTYENQLKPQSGTSQIFEFVSAEGKMEQATFLLRAKAPGTAAVGVNATGEVQNESGAYMWGGGGSNPLEITVKSNP